MRTSFLVLLLVACGETKTEKAPAKSVVEHKKVDNIAMVLPDGWTSSYSPDADKWTFGVGDVTHVVFERTPVASAASPEALRQWLRFNVWDKGAEAEIESRETINDGFAATFVVRPGERRETYVIKQIYNDDWFRCVSSIVDATLREHALALCKSLKRPKRR